MLIINVGIPVGKSWDCFFASGNEGKMGNFGGLREGEIGIEGRRVEFGIWEFGNVGICGIGDLGLGMLGFGNHHNWECGNIGIWNFVGMLGSGNSGI